LHAGFWWGNLKEGDHLKDPSMDGRIILKYILKTWDGEAWIGLFWLRIGTVVGCCECSNEPSGFIKCREFPD
jgi:hypothetical protein